MHHHKFYYLNFKKVQTVIIFMDLILHVDGSILLQHVDTPSIDYHLWLAAQKCWQDKYKGLYHLKFGYKFYFYVRKVSCTWQVAL